MIGGCERYLSAASLISLDHDLVPESQASSDPGTGLEVAVFLAQHKPVCPVILHTSNYERRWSMHNELRFGGWQVEVVPPFDNHDWIRGAWLKMARELVAVQTVKQTKISGPSSS